MAAMLLAGSKGFADDPLPSEEEALARALENHPDIISAKAKVALAEAELSAKRMEVSRQILGLYNGTKNIEAQINSAKANLDVAHSKLAGMERAFKNAAVSQSELQQAQAEVKQSEAAIMQVMAQREQIAKELHLLAGKAAVPLAPGAKLPTKSTGAALQPPKGPIIEKVQMMMNKRLALDFAEIPLTDVADYLGQTTGVPFTVNASLKEIGIEGQTPMTIKTSEVPVGAALQALEDAYEPLVFAIRDYGVIITTKDFAQSHGFTPLLDYVKETTAEKRR